MVVLFLPYYRCLMQIETITPHKNYQLVRRNGIFLYYETMTASGSEMWQSRLKCNASGHLAGSGKGNARSALLHLHAVGPRAH